MVAPFGESLQIAPHLFRRGNLVGSRSGQVDPSRGFFQFNAEYDYLVEDGECTKMVRDVSFSRDILSTLH